MNNDREQAQQPGIRDTGNAGQERAEQFNELSELSLEERMNAADHIGEPMSTIEEVAATGTIRGSEEIEEMEEDTTDEKN